MSSIPVYSMTEVDMTEFANHIKDLLVYAGLLDKDVAEQYAIVIMKPSKFGKLWAKFRDHEDNQPAFAVMKVIASSNPTGDVEIEDESV